MLKTHKQNCNESLFIIGCLQATFFLKLIQEIFEIYSTMLVRKAYPVVTGEPPVDSAYTKPRTHTHIKFECIQTYTYIVTHIQAYT
jgi:hypothetical protein